MKFASYLAACQHSQQVKFSFVISKTLREAYSNNSIKFQINIAHDWLKYLIVMYRYITFRYFLVKENFQFINQNSRSS